MPEVIDEELKITTQVEPTENRESPLPDVSADHGPDVGGDASSGPGMDIGDID